jgi:hypothetical protein
MSLFWRKGMLSPKVRALIEILTAHSDMGKTRRAGRTNGNFGQASANGRSRA